MASEIPISFPSQIVAYFCSNSTSAVLSAIFLALLSTICWFLSPLKDSSSYQYPKRRLSQLYNNLLQNDEDVDDKEPLACIVQRFKLQKEEEEGRFLDFTDECDNVPMKNARSSSWSLLKLLSVRLKNHPDEINNAAELNVHSLTLDFIKKSLPTAEHNMVSVAIDITNGILQTKTAIKVLRDDEDDSKLILFIDTLLSIMKIYLTAIASIEFDDDANGSAVDTSMMDFFIDSGYKFILALGLVVAENPDVKCLCADRGSILTVLDCLKQQRYSPSLSKWCLWSLMNICFENPPNKSIFVHKGGLSVVIGTIKHHANNIDIQKQGLSLLFYILSDDIQSKFHLKDARKTVLSLGIITVIEAAQINYKEDSAVQDPCSHLLLILAAECS